MDPNPRTVVGAIDSDRFDPLEFAAAEAARAGRWDVVAQIAELLRMRMLEGSNVTVIDKVKRNR